MLLIGKKDERFKKSQHSQSNILINSLYRNNIAKLIFQKYYVWSFSEGSPKLSQFANVIQFQRIANRFIRESGESRIDSIPYKLHPRLFLLYKQIKDIRKYSSKR